MPSQEMNPLQLETMNFIKALVNDNKSLCNLGDWP
jgi:hypothetical protein